MTALGSRAFEGGRPMGKGPRARGGNTESPDHYILSEARHLGLNRFRVIVLLVCVLDLWQSQRSCSL